MSDDKKFALLARLIQKLYEVTDTLNKEFGFSARKFTLDGHLLGSIGEVLAQYMFDLVLEKPSRQGHDAKTRDGKKVQVKLTAIDSGVALNSEPKFLIVFHLTDDGLKVIYNG